MWTLRNRLWNGLTLFKYRTYKPAHVPVPREEGTAGKVELVSYVRRYDDVPIEAVPVADRVPADEASSFRSTFYKLQAGLYEVVSPMEPGLPAVDDDAQRALDHAYASPYRRCFPAPTLPDEYQEPLDLGAVAVASPYSCFLQADGEGGFAWDLGSLDGYELHPGLRPLGVRVRFDVDEGTRRLRPVEIDCDLGVCKPDEGNWEQAQRLALCAATTSATLVRHFDWIHFTASAHVSAATRNRLPAAHPLRRLLWPHVYRTQYTNDIITNGQMVPGADFENVFSFTHRGMCRLMDDAYGQYELLGIDPERDAARRGIDDARIEVPVLANRMEHFAVLHGHARRYLDLYFGSDSDLRDDEHVHAWVEELDGLVPGGARAFLGDDLTVAGLARLVGSFIHLVSVEHEVLGTGLWDYQLWTQVQPARVYRDGRREPIDVYQRLVNFNFLLNVNRTPLLQDFSYMALDEPGAAAFRTLSSELRALQARIDAEPPAPWKVSPKILEANINV